MGNTEGSMKTVFKTPDSSPMSLKANDEEDAVLELKRIGMLDLSTNCLVIKQNDLLLSRSEAVVLLFKKAAKKINIVKMNNLIEGGVVGEEAYKSLHAMCSALRHCDIKEVHLDENQLGERGVEACSDILRCMRIEKLYLNRSGITTSAALLVSELLLDICCPPLKVLQYHRNRSGNSGAVAMSKVISNSPSLTELVYTSSNATAAGCMSIATAVATVTRLEKLDLSDNSFDKEAAQRLGESLKHHDALKELRLKRCDLTNKGLMRLMFALQDDVQFPELTILDLSGNHLTVDILDALMIWLNAILPNITELILDDNLITDYGAEKLAKVLGQPQVLKLEKISLRSCGLTLDGWRALQAAADDHPRLGEIAVEELLLSRPSRAVSELPELLRGEVELYIPQPLDL
jgi:Ran GTPase-activating protein 1